MKTCKIPHTDLTVSRLGYGCAGLVGWDDAPVSAEDIQKAMRAVHTAHQQGITLFDHADLYAFGKSEAIFGEVLRQSPGFREQIVIQSKCGQYFPKGWQPGRPIGVNLSREHILRAVEGSLKRLSTDYLDILLLHAPDALMEPQEVAAAFDELNRSGKVRYFGVSNHTPDQIQVLQETLRQPLVVNQVHLGLAHSYLIADGLEFTLEISKGSMRDHGYAGVSGTGTLGFCRRQGIQVQAWSPLRGDLLNPPADAKPELKQVAQMLATVAKNKDATPAAIALAWLLRHPIGIVPLIGASHPDHIVENCAADRINLSRDEWYALFAAAAEVQSRFI